MPSSAPRCTRLRSSRRLGRRLSDIAELNDRLQFLGIPMHAVKLGEVTTMHMALWDNGTAISSPTCDDKTNVTARTRPCGKIPGGHAYGMRSWKPSPESATSSPRRLQWCSGIFRDFAAGKSPRGIARALTRRTSQDRRARMG